MNTLHDAFERRAGNVGAPDLNADELVGLGERRLRRRRLSAVLGSAAAVAVAVAIGITALSGTGTPPRPGPIDRTPHQKTPPTRQIVYSDYRFGVGGGNTVHFGNRVLVTGDHYYVHLDVTDDGFFYTDRGGVWFSNGGTAEEVGPRLCGAPRKGAAGHYATRGVVAARSGSEAAWFDCADPARPTLVVFDTSSRHEVARRPVAFCKQGCELVDVTSDHVYFDGGSHEYRLNVEGNRLRTSTPQEYAEDLRSHPRGLVIGDSWQTGRPTDAIGQQFWVDGSRLVPVDTVANEPVSSAAFGTLTRRPVWLRLPRGYHADHDELGRGDFSIFEWLDDDTVALFGGAGEILSCQLSTGRCVIAERAPEAETWRILPSLPLPG